MHNQGWPSEVAAVAGPTLFLEPPKPSLGWSIVRSSGYNQPFEWPLWFTRLLWAPTSNLSVKREAFRAIGGFRSLRSTPVGGEDVDMGVRLNEAGGEIASDHKAVVFHRAEHLGRLTVVGAQLIRFGRADADLCRLHPHRKQWHANRVLTPVAAGLVSYAFARSLSRAFQTFMGSMGCLFVVDFVPRLILQRKHSELPTLIASVLLDWLFEIGEAAEKLRRRQLGDLCRRFGYLDAKVFTVKRAVSGPRWLGPYLVFGRTGGERIRRRDVRWSSS
jgi:hypothetical protein